MIRKKEKHRTVELNFRSSKNNAPMKKLDHIDEKGKISMIDTTGKPESLKEAGASGFIHLKPETIRLIKENELEKGEE